MRSLKGTPPPFHCADSIQEIPHTLTLGLMRVACSLPLFLHAAQTNNTLTRAEGEHQAGGDEVLRFGLYR